MAAKPSIAIVGPGRLGSALTSALVRGQYSVVELVTREAKKSVAALAQLAKARVSTLRTAVLDADLVWFCVPDREIAGAAKALTKTVSWKKKIAFHSSGALASDELDGLRRNGAAVASVHPLMTFVRGAVPSLENVPFSLEGDKVAIRAARRIARDLGAVPYMIRKKDKAAYHAWGAFTSPLIVALLVASEQVARRAGTTREKARKRMLPIVKQTIENYARLGPAGAFSGPLVRGDVAIVARHLQVLKKVPEARHIYLALAHSALRYLPVGQRKKLQAILKA